MSYNNRLYPHPVLGIEDDIDGEFSVDLTYSSDKDYISLAPIFKLAETNLFNLVSEAKTSFYILVYCKSTFFRQVYKVTSTVPQPLKIPATQLRGEVEVDFFLCANTEIENYKSDNFNLEYSSTVFDIDRSDILAYGGKGKFFANKSPEELKSISSLIRIANSGEKTKPMYNEYTGEKITIFLCEEDYQDYQWIARTNKLANIFHSSIVLPALVDALYFIETEEAKDHSDRRWFRALEEIKTKSKTKDVFQIAQNILHQPSERTFKTILREFE